jgi:hypothetical protein
MPIPPLNACSQPKAFAIINSITSGKCFAFTITMKRDKKMYPNAMTGTIMLLTLAIR